MKTIKTTAKMIALTLVMSIATNVTAFASTEKSPENPYYADIELYTLIELDSEFSKIESTLRDEGILECANTEIIVVLGEDDEVVYQGSHQIEDENNAFLTRLMTKADFIMASGNKSFYKVF
ncbi:hypothetical protein SAMN05661096_00425 [Marivirga sericea]|uniref:Uncharacterized protein n=1 Tax=Marivirga sericea TaxID=1028 RepID=A0A1X7IAL6_9BACT|nr:hypothetical protein [Marivirga sericea]SMG11684.1 hypothetical protein SAMN05661096_00425 [Marivirga sericea]